MKIRETTAAEYKDIFGRHPHIYNSAEFSELNRYKADRLYYLLFEDSKTRFGIVLGDDGERLLSPFSAPFGGFSTSKHQSVMPTDEAARLLKSFGESLHKRSSSHFRRQSMKRPSQYGASARSQEKDG